MNQNINYNLNQGQKDAAEAFFTFLFSDEKEFIISGQAGVGKTYWMGYIIDIVMPRYHETCKLIGIKPDYENVVMTATTNKAAEVLAAATNQPTQTIHSYLNLTVFEDYESGKTRLTQNPRTWVVHEKTIIFIDECSMIDAQLYKIIHEGTHKCKIIYVGDHNQLAPVMETISPVYTRNTKIFELTQQMRNNTQPALMNICSQLRQTVSTGIFHPIHEVPGVIDSLTDEDLELGLAEVFAQQNKDSRILAYTNKRVMQYNDHIRQNRNLPVNFTVGELLINNSAVKVSKNKMLSAESEIRILKDYGVRKLDISNNVFLDINIFDIVDHLGALHYNIPVPWDKDHFNNLLKYYKSEKNWERYYYLKQNFPDFRPRDAATVHKSQGSTYQSVFIDLGNISTCKQADQAARMLYVAFSRATTRIYVYGELSQKFGGFIKA